jgi:hypothetical protein
LREAKSGTFFDPDAASDKHCRRPPPKAFGSGIFGPLLYSPSRLKIVRMASAPRALDTFG